MVIGSPLSLGRDRATISRRWLTDVLYVYVCMWCVGLEGDEVLEVLLSLTDFSAFKDSMIAYLRGQAASATTTAEAGHKGPTHKCNTSHGTHQHISAPHIIIYIHGRRAVSDLMRCPVLCGCGVVESKGESGEGKEERPQHSSPSETRDQDSRHDEEKPYAYTHLHYTHT